MLQSNNKIEIAHFNVYWLDDNKLEISGGVNKVFFDLGSSDRIANYINEEFKNHMENLIDVSGEYKECEEVTKYA